MFKEYGIVYSNEKINDKVSYGTKGVIVMILDKELPIFEVEFFDNDNEILDVTEVLGSQLKSLDV
ncbi:DUF4926 domain-containing protein [Listeria booriae]|uniref:DUF4926 domain-containing protein n=1 Tax=Listeria booriae TaxID=1552123 RepID=A0A842D3Y6_9LIST|nr:DUF4926 domain-containing protein [Listeria booriae]MBC2005512.1 DUF4926 domain-containing protein [Listeria booriae]